MNAITSRAELETQLRAEAARLVARQAVRAAFSGLAGGAVALGLGVLFLDALPRMLLATHAGWPWLLLTAVAGAIVGTGWELRRYRAPSLQDAALALEARLAHDSGALAAALKVGENSVFYAPVLARAANELQQARQAPAPLLIPTRKLVLVPALALAAGVALIAVVSIKPADARGSSGAAPAANQQGSDWPGVDVGGTRGEADRAAYRKALGMKETAAQLNRTAAVLRDESAGQSARDSALKNAKQALSDAQVNEAGLAAEDFPTAAPVDETERAALAERLEAAAGKLGAAAAELEHGDRTATVDSGKAGEFQPGKARTELVPFPVLTRMPAAASEAIAAQTPARRDMAVRAVEAFERLQNR